MKKLAKLKLNQLNKHGERMKTLYLPRGLSLSHTINIYCCCISL